jgi:hypothetical protein
MPFAESPQDRAARIATAARSRMDTTYIAREWWLVTHPGGDITEVYMCPAATQQEMLIRYPGCGVVPR